MSVHLDNTYGAAFIGMVAAATLHGVSCVQAFYYFTNQHDIWGIKFLVIAVMLLETTHQALITHTVYTYTLTDWGNSVQLRILVWSLVLEVIVTGVTAFIVQSFLTIRIWRLSGRNIYITGVSAILVVGGLASFILYVSKAYQMKDLSDLRAIKGESIAINVLGAAADILIAATLCTLLNFSRTGFRKSDAVIKKLIMFSVNTGLLTSICALASLITILAAGNTFIYAAFFFCLGRLYTNSLLATLNARMTLRGVGNSEVETSFSLRDLTNKGPSTQRQNISIKIDTTQEYHPGDRQKLGGRSPHLPDSLVLTYDAASEREPTDEENTKEGPY